MDLLMNNPLAFDDYDVDPVGDIDDEAYDLAYDEGCLAAENHWNPFAEPKNPYQPIDPRAHAWALGFRAKYDNR
jgi:hypothetical protein